MEDAGCSRFAGIALVAAMSVFAAGGRAMYASSAEESQERCSTGVGVSATPLSITLEATLTGTVMVEGGRSLALFEPPGGQGVMREGEAFSDGTLLCEVRADRIFVGRGGSRREILLGSKGQPTATVLPRSVSPAEAQAALVAPAFAVEHAPASTSGGRREARPTTRASLLDFRVAKFHAMLERREAQPSVQ